MKVKYAIDSIQTAMEAGSLQAYNLRELAEQGLIDDYDNQSFNLMVYPPGRVARDVLKISCSGLDCNFVLSALQLPGPIEEHLRTTVFQQLGKVSVRVTSGVVVIEIRQNGELWSTKLSCEQHTEEAAFTCFH